jgi:hypothetical protein
MILPGTDKEVLIDVKGISSSFDDIKIFLYLLRNRSQKKLVKTYDHSEIIQANPATNTVKIIISRELSKNFIATDKIYAEYKTSKEDLAFPDGLKVSGESNLFIAEVIASAAPEAFI